MNEWRFLSGKVVKRSLPVINGSPGPGVGALKRLLLPQGELAQFYDGEEPIRYIAAVQLRPGTIRGNHYHEFKDECVYLIRGELQILVEDIDSRIREEVLLRTGDLASIAPRVAHVLRPLSDGEGVEFSTVRFKAADSFKYPLLKDSE